MSVCLSVNFQNIASFHVLGITNEVVVKIRALCVRSVHGSLVHLGQLKELMLDRMGKV